MSILNFFFFHFHSGPSRLSILTLAWESLCGHVMFLATEFLGLRYIKAVECLDGWLVWNSAFGNLILDYLSLFMMCSPMWYKFLLFYFYFFAQGISSEDSSAPFGLMNINSHNIAATFIFHSSVSLLPISFRWLLRLVYNLPVHVSMKIAFIWIILIEWWGMSSEICYKLPVPSSLDKIFSFIQNF